MSYKEFVSGINKKIWKWNYAIPLGILAVIMSTLLEETSPILADAIGVFNLLIVIGAISGIADIVKHFRSKKQNLQ